MDDSVISCLARSCRRVATLDVTACKLLTDASSGILYSLCTVAFLLPARHYFDRARTGAIASMGSLAELGMEMVNRMTDAGE